MLKPPSKLRRPALHRSQQRRQAVPLKHLDLLEMYTGRTARPKPARMNLSSRKQQPCPAPKAFPVNSIHFKNKGLTDVTNRLEGRCEETYIAAVKRVFQGIDIFKRGSIGEANINSLIPESALYFLGGVFQKIRQDRLLLSQAQFVQMSIPIYHRSAPEDISSFITDVMAGSRIQSQQQERMQESKVETIIAVHPEKIVPEKIVPEKIVPEKRVLQNQAQRGTIDTATEGQRRRRQRSLRAPVASPQLDKMQLEQLTPSTHWQAVSSQQRQVQESYLVIRKDVMEKMAGERSLFTFYNQRGKQGLRQSLGAETDRIDRLSHRLQNYIELNIKKIEKSKQYSCG